MCQKFFIKKDIEKLTDIFVNALNSCYDRKEVIPLLMMSKVDFIPNLSLNYSKTLLESLKDVFFSAN